MRGAKAVVGEVGCPVYAAEKRVTRAKTLERQGEARVRSFGSRVAAPHNLDFGSWREVAGIERLLR